MGAPLNFNGAPVYMTVYPGYFQGPHWISMGRPEIVTVYPGYFQGPHWISMGLPEISRVILTGMECKVIGWTTANLIHIFLGVHCQVYPGFSRRPIEFQWGSWKYPGQTWQVWMECTVIGCTSANLIHSWATHHAVKLSYWFLTNGSKQRQLLLQIRTNCPRHPAKSHQWDFLIRIWVSWQIS